MNTNLFGDFLRFCTFKFSDFYDEKPSIAFPQTRKLNFLKVQVQCQNQLLRVRSNQKKKKKRKTLSSVKFYVRVLGSQWQHDLLLGGF